jgi:hypothetical protein
MNYTDERVVSDGAALFRPKAEDESLEDYRHAFAHHVLVCSHDYIMANEIILGRGWDKWTEEEILDWLLDTPPSEVGSTPLGTNWLLKYKEKLAAHRRHRTRLAGAVASNPEEVRRYQEGSRARRTSEDDPAGLQEAIRGKLECAPDDAPKGVRIRHFDKKGHEVHSTVIHPFAKPEKKG